MTSGFAALRSQVNDVVGSLDYIEIVFNHQQRTTGVNQCPKRSQQFIDIVEMQARSWFVEDIESLRAGAFREMGSEFDALRFAA